jgi:hypothetical protein
MIGKELTMELPTRLEAIGTIGVTLAFLAILFI